ncbi:Translation initiation factor 3 subunit J component [Coemansia sp. RSA 1813]|nr:Translation initiation factor 3 subunit J component [Coemansia sp. RSA 1843]KAJ2216853.1 Translation initiation factor 3 subunit J component [Coemansia sp. RSA 487]KAJ2571855.1 Translation initiation factor 3 subunit J component [Coemansia sp. RSA 1813]
MSDWEDSDNEAASTFAPPRKNKWGEEEESDSDIPDNWDESDNSSDEENAKAADVPAPKPKTKKTLAEKIAERQAEREAKKSAAEAALDDDSDEDDGLDAQERERLRQVESDLQNTDDLFAGLTVKDTEMNKTIVNINPKTQAEFDEFQKALVERIQKCQNNRVYVPFLEKFIRELALPLKDVDVRKFASTLTALANEKQRAARDNKTKKKSGKKATVVSAPKNQMDMTDYSKGFDDFDDFM